MIEALKSWIISISTAIFFISAVELILPNNSTKKYTKFVLGLILITVVLNPIIKLYDKSFNINGYIESAARYFDEKKYQQEDYEKYKKTSIENTAEVFASNLGQLCIKKLKEEFPKDDYEVSIKANYEKEEENFIISKVNIGLSEGNIKKIKKVNIENSKEVSTKDVINEEKAKEIINFISKELNIEKQKISVYKM